MPIAQDQLDFEHHLEAFKKFAHDSDNVQSNTYLFNEAQTTHCLSVIQAARDIQSEIVSVGNFFGFGKVYYQLVYGAAFRSRLIWSALRTLRKLVPPDRIAPLPHDETFEVARALNDIYIHIRGALDNYAWALIHHSNSISLKKLRPMQVSLFSDKLLSDGSLAKFQSVILEYSDWAQTLKTLRDPSAHQIPLRVVHTVLTHDEVELYKSKYDEWSNAGERLLELMDSESADIETNSLSEEVDRLYEALQNIGKFAAAIQHDPDKGTTPLYPTVPQDIGRFLSLTRKLNAILLK